VVKLASEPSAFAGGLTLFLVELWWLAITPLLFERGLAIDTVNVGSPTLHT